MKRRKIHIYIYILLIILSIYPICRGVHHAKRFKLVKIVKTDRIAHEALVDKYLTNKNGIEIGNSVANDFHLYEKGGAYCNVNFSVNAWTDIYKTKGEVVNIVSLGDDLPFKDNTFDYVFTSHVMEHFFDPIKAIQEHLRVIKKGGVLLYIVPHSDVTYDNDRKSTPLQEFIDRHNGALTIKDYMYATDGKGLRDKVPPMIGDTHILKTELKTIQDEKIKNVFTTFNEDDHHHWSVWRPQDFLKMAKHFGFNVIEWKEKDDNYGNGFVVVIQK